MKYILALDQGTSSSRAILFDHAGAPVAQASREFPQIFPQPGWVSHDPEAIWSSQLDSAREAIAAAGASADDIAAIGITNQRETTVVWDRATSTPINDAVVWQCRRTADICEDLRQRGLEAEVRARTGLVIDAYFSGTKVRWLLDNSGQRAQERAAGGELAFGTVDSWLIHKLTGHRRGGLVFPSLRPGRPLSENTLNMALRAIGYDTQAQHCAHGFRSSASSLLHEQGHSSQVIELCLAHTDTNSVRAVYNRSERLAERRELMQAWADYLDELRQQ